MRSPSSKITVAALLSAAGLVTGYLESFIVLPVNIPGIRIGLANITTVIAMYTAGPLYALIVSSVRVILSSLLFGSPVSFLYSFCGAILALAGMVLFKKLGFSIYGVSVTGAVLHNLAQITVAFFMVGSGYMFVYMPVLILTGIGAGLIVGYLSKILTARISFGAGTGREGRSAVKDNRIPTSDEREGE